MSAVLDLPQTAKPNSSVSGNGQRTKTHRFTVKEYDAMIEHGILTTEDRVELLNGEIICKMPKGPKHASCNDDASDFFKEMLGTRVVVRSQNPLVLDEFSEPEPDLLLVRPPRSIYRERHPTPDDVFLVIEISDSTLSLDRNAKALAYARAGLPQYLILNVAGRVIEDYRDPAPDGYRTKRTYAAGQSFPLVAFPEFIINFEDLLSLD